MRILNREALISQGNREGRSHAIDIMEAGLSAADPYYNVFKLMRLEGDRILIGNPDFQIEGDPRGGDVVYDVKDIDRVFFFGAGKGMQRVAQAVEEIFGDKLTGGHLIVKHGDEANLSKIGVTHAGHPVPDEYCVVGCQRIIDMINDVKLTERDLVITCMGSGVSSLLTYPIPGLTLEEVMAVTRNLQIKRGMPTHDLSHIRNNIDGLKGGRITRLMHPAKMVHMVTIDLNADTDSQVGGYQGRVVDNYWLHTLPDCTSCASALAILEKWDACDDVPPAVLNHLKNATSDQDALKAEEFQAMDTHLYAIMSATKGFSYAAVQKAKELGYQTRILTRATTAEAAPVGRFVANIAMNCELNEEPFETPCCLIGLGELVVTVDNENGVGGRNQEYALAAAQRIAGSKRVVMAACDTDGTDGPGGFICEQAQAQGVDTLAGAVVDGYTIAQAKEQGIDLFTALKRHDTSAVLWALNSGIVATHNISQLDLAVTLIMDHDG